MGRSILNSSEHYFSPSQAQPWSQGNLFETRRPVACSAMNFQCLTDGNIALEGELCRRAVQTTVGYWLSYCTRAGVSHVTRGTNHHRQAVMNSTLERRIVDLTVSKTHRLKGNSHRQQIHKIVIPIPPSLVKMKRGLTLQQ